MTGVGKCVPCNGTGKTVKGQTPQGAVLGVCVFCTGDGQRPDAETLTKRLNEMGHQVMIQDPPKPKKSKKKDAQALPDAGSSLGDAVKDVFSTAGDALLDAGKQVLATQVMEAGVNTTRALAANMGYSLPEHPLVDRALQNGAPLLLMLACAILRTQAPNLAPATLLEAINATSTYAFKGQSKETIQELQTIAVPMALQLVAGIAQSVPQLSGGSGQMNLIQAMLTGDSGETS